MPLTSEPRAPSGSPNLTKNPPDYVRTHRRPPIIVVEFAPLATERMLMDSSRSLWAGFIGALVMLIFSIFMWKLLGDRARDAKELERKELLASLGKMSAVLSHELRNPLAAAMGQTELLEELLPTGEPRDTARDAREELEKMERVTSDLLALVNASRITLEPTELRPWLLVVLSTRGESLFAVTVDDDVPEAVPIDPVNLARALDLVIDNAIMADPSGQRIEVRILRREPRLDITVRDQGPGIPGDLDIFAPFVSTRASRPGLGLSIAREIISAHGGSLSAKNHPDHGAIFTLTVPM